MDAILLDCQDTALLERRLRLAHLPTNRTCAHPQGNLRVCVRCAVVTCVACERHTCRPLSVRDVFGDAFDRL